MVPLSYYMILSGVVFLTGLVGVLIRRNIIILLLSIELMLNATNINFVAFSYYLHDIAGQVFRAVGHEIDAARGIRHRAQHGRRRAGKSAQAIE